MIAEECVSPCATSQPKPNRHTHTQTQTSTLLRVIAFQSTQALSSPSLSLSNKPSFSSWGIRITSGINWISLGDASCTHNTASFLSLLSYMVYVYGIVWLVIVHLREEKKTHFLIDRDNITGPLSLSFFHLSWFLSLFFQTSFFFFFFRF